MVDIRDLAERLWNGSVPIDEVHPVHVRFPEGQELAAGLLYYKGIAGVNTIDTGDGLVMLDTGAVNDSRRLYQAVRGWRPEAPLKAAVFSHHHVDHIFGVGPFEEEAEEKDWPEPRVYAHVLVEPNLDRYKRTAGWNTAINIRQFALPPGLFRWQEEFRYPDISYEGRHTFTAGDCTFDLHHARGETEDTTWTWVPERRLLAPGDLFIWAVPNAGNPQKVQRYSLEWAVALREMAALGADLLLPGHGLPIFGADRIRVALTDTADLLESLEAQVIDLMNQGAALDTVIHTVQAPPHLLSKPYLAPVYDDPQFIVRNIWRLYGGWHDGEPDNLLPAPRAEQAREWVTLAGGVERVLTRVAELRDAGDLRLACHLVEFAVIVAPGSSEVHALRREIYAARALQQRSSMARNILNHAAISSERGLRDIAGNF